MKNDKQSDEMNQRNDVEDVLTFARPRQRPDSTARQSAYVAVKAAWQAEVRRRRNRQFAMLGIAASAILVITVTFIAGQLTLDHAPVLDAMLVRITGDGVTSNRIAIRSDVIAAQKLQLHTGDVLTTDAASRAAVAWDEHGSLRIDQNSRISLLGDGAIRLEYGTVYYDSHTFGTVAPASASLSIETALGHVVDVGTQFLTDLSPSGLRISVREGKVKFNSERHGFSVNAGSTASIGKDNNVKLGRILPTDTDWNWATSVAPELAIDGQSTLDLINWVARETGLTVRFASASARDFARDDRIFGMGMLDPLQALSLIPTITKLKYEIDDQTIIISDTL